eukprot:Pgem_evm2s10550
MITTCGCDTMEVRIPQPQLISQYFKYNGQVDHHNRRHQSRHFEYREEIRSQRVGNESDSLFKNLILAPYPGQVDRHNRRHQDTLNIEKKLEVKEREMLFVDSFLLYSKTAPYPRPKTQKMFIMK